MDSRQESLINLLFIRYQFIKSKKFIYYIVNIPDFTLPFGFKIYFCKNFKIHFNHVLDIRIGFLSE